MSDTGPADRPPADQPAHLQDGGAQRRHLRHREPPCSSSTLPYRPCPQDVGHQLLHQWPTYLAYLVSFATIGNAWLNHSVITEYLERADAILLRLNLVLLFFVSVLPFPTHMLAEYLATRERRAHRRHGYGLDLLAIRRVFASLTLALSQLAHLARPGQRKRKCGP